MGLFLSQVASCKIFNVASPLSSLKSSHTLAMSRLDGFQIQPTNPPTPIAMEIEYRTRHIHTAPQTDSLSFFLLLPTRRVRIMRYVVGYMGPFISASLQVHRFSFDQTVLSSNSFASLTLVAKYGLPPRSGWLRSMSVRWALRTLSLVMDRSLQVNGISLHCKVLSFMLGITLVIE